MSFTITMIRSHGDMGSSDTFRKGTDISRETRGPSKPVALLVYRHGVSTVEPCRVLKIGCCNLMVFTSHVHGTAGLRGLCLFEIASLMRSCNIVQKLSYHALNKPLYREDAA